MNKHELNRALNWCHLTVIKHHLRLHLDRQSNRSVQPKHLYEHHWPNAQSSNIFGVVCIGKYCEMLLSNLHSISTVYVSDFSFHFDISQLISFFQSKYGARYSLHTSVFYSIFPSPDQQLTASLKPVAYNTGGSLPDLTNIQFPPPLPTPLDSDDAAAASFSYSNSTHTLASTQGNTPNSCLLTFNTFPPIVMCWILMTFHFNS